MHNDVSVYYLMKEVLLIIFDGHFLKFYPPNQSTHPINFF